MDIKKYRGHGAMRGSADHWSQGNVGDEMPIHDVNVQRITTSGDRSTTVITKLREVCGKNRRLNKEPSISQVRIRWFRSVHGGHAHFAVAFGSFALAS
jgi:hypothetical protein